MINNAGILANQVIFTHNLVCLWNVRHIILLGRRQRNIKHSFIQADFMQLFNVSCTSRTADR